MSPCAFSAKDKCFHVKLSFDCLRQADLLKHSTRWVHRVYLSIVDLFRFYFCHSQRHALLHANQRTHSRKWRCFHIKLLPHYFDENLLFRCHFRDMSPRLLSEKEECMKYFYVTLAEEKGQAFLMLNSLKLNVLINFLQRQFWVLFTFRFALNMDPQNATDVETSSLSEDIIEMDVGVEGMSDGEIQSEWNHLQNQTTNENDDLNATVIERPKEEHVKDLATPKLASAVVVSVSFKRLPSVDQSSPTVPKDVKNQSKRNHNRNGSSKRNCSKTSAGTLISMLSKVKVSNEVRSTATIIETGKNASKQGAASTNGGDNRRL